MNKGYSLLLGELIAADELTYEDTSDNLVICPSCKEPVVKVERLSGDGERISEYLRHFKKQPLSDECELRVNAMNLEQENKKAGITRGQSIDKFNKQLKEVFLKSAFNQVFKQNIDADVISKLSFRDLKILYGKNSNIPNERIESANRNIIKRANSKLFKRFVPILPAKPKDKQEAELENKKLIRDLIDKTYHNKSKIFKDKLSVILTDIFMYILEPKNSKMCNNIFSHVYELIRQSLEHDNDTFNTILEDMKSIALEYADIILTTEDNETLKILFSLVTDYFQDTGSNGPLLPMIRNIEATQEKALTSLLIMSLSQHILQSSMAILVSSDFTALWEIQIPDRKAA